MDEIETNLIKINKKRNIRREKRVDRRGGLQMLPDEPHGRPYRQPSDNELLSQEFGNLSSRGLWMLISKLFDPNMPIPYDIAYTPGLARATNRRIRPRQCVRRELGHLFDGPGSAGPNGAVIINQDDGQVIINNQESVRAQQARERREDEINEE